MRSSSPLRPFVLAGGLALAAVAPSQLAEAAPSGVGSASAPAVAPRRVLASPTEVVNTCAGCHATLSDSKLRAPAKDCAGSAHRDDRLSCVGCHGGDSRDPTVGAHSRALAFKPHPTHAEIAPLCGSCHSDASLMRRLNGRLQIGQRELFDLSLHGRLAAAGDTNAPDCAVCHGKHDIVSPTSPAAPVNRLNVSKLCGGCHAEKARMAKYDVRTDQLALWQKSVHGVAFARGDPNAPTCTGCHGAHGSAPPDSASVGHACGRCHETEMQLFERSPHSPAFRKRGIPQCVACHGNHGIAPATPLLVGTTPESSCMKCHGNDEGPRKVADSLATLLGGAHARAAGARATVTNARDRGILTPRASYPLDRLATAEQKLRGVVHTLDPAQLAAGVASIEEAAAEAERLVAEAEGERKSELRDYYVALAFAAALLLTLALKARQLAVRRRIGAP